MDKEALVVAYALLQQLANVFAKCIVGKHTLIHLKLRPVTLAEWSRGVSDLNAPIASVLHIAQTELRRPFARDSSADSFKFQNSLLNQEDSILKIGSRAKKE